MQTHFDVFAIADYKRNTGGKAETTRDHFFPLPQCFQFWGLIMFSFREIFNSFASILLKSSAVDLLHMENG